MAVSTATGLGAMNLENYWKLPAGAVTVTSTGGGTVVSLTPGPDAGVAQRIELESLEEVGIHEARIELSAGAAHLSFCLEEALESFYLERYRSSRSPAKRLLSGARSLYYLSRPFIPRPLQIAFRRRFASVQRRAPFPRWPIDTSLDDLLHDTLRGAMLASGWERIPTLGWWPGNKHHAIVLRHDVETDVGVGNVRALTRLEEKYGFRSIWNFVPERYHFDVRILEELREQGHEIGVHGLFHDGRLFASRKVFSGRAVRINDYLRSWRSTGFAAPSAIRRLGWISQQLEIEHDSSVPTAEVYGPQPGGCCTILPFFLDNDVVELPITMQQDHTLFEILQEPDLTTWFENARVIRQRGGALVLVVHPDYMLTPSRLGFYEAMLERLADDPEGWRVLPRELAAWWRTRRDSTLVDGPDGPEVHGPAQGVGRVRWVRVRDGSLVFE